MVEWIKNLRVTRDEKDSKIREYDIINEDDSGVIKEDVLNQQTYEQSSQLQKMLYHAYKKIEALEARIAKLEG